MVEEELKAAGIEIMLDKIRIANIPTAEQLEDVTNQILKFE